MPAIILAAISSFQVIGFSKYNVTFTSEVIIFFVKFVSETQVKPLNCE